LKIVQSGFATAVFLVINKRRAIHRGKTEVIAADGQAVGRVAGQLGELAGRFGHVFGHQRGIKMNDVTAHVGPVFFENGQRLLIVKGNAHVRQNGERGLVNRFQPFFADNLVRGQFMQRLHQASGRHGRFLPPFPSSTTSITSHNILRKI
jgi:hypothetical protein